MNFKSIYFFLIVIIFLGSSLNTRAQESDRVSVDLTFDLHLMLPNDRDLSQKFDYGGGALFGVSVFVPEIKMHFIPQVGFDFMQRKVGYDDTYKEHIKFFSYGLEAMYKLVSNPGYELLPFIGLTHRNVSDNYLVANGDIIISSNGGSSLDYDTRPSIFSGSAVALNIGFENRLSDVFFIRVSYEFFNPSLTIALQNSYDNVDSQIFDTPTKSLNFSTFKFGIGAYFW